MDGWRTSGNPKSGVEIWEQTIVSTDDRSAESSTEQIADEEASNEAQILELSDRDMDALLAALTSPPEPNEAMLRSIQRWRKLGTPV
jgi:hypothetical protein